MTSRALDAAAFALLCAIWGSTWLAIRIGLGGAPAFLAASLRFVLASVTLLAVAAVLRRRLPRTRQEWTLVLFVGLVLFTADYGLIYWGEGNGVASGLSAILFATYPLQTAIAANFVVAKEKLSAQKTVGIALGFAGILVIFREQLAADWGIFFPMLAIVLSATCASLSAVALKRWGHDTDPVAFNAAAMATGAIALAGVSLAAGEAWAVPSWPAGIGAIVYLALAGSVVTFVTWNWLLKRAQATTVSYVAFVTPIVAVLLGVGVGDERFDPLVLAGAAVTLSGIWLSTSRRVGIWMRAAMGAGAVSDATADPPEEKP
ncbi:MAG: hypothetical protein A3K65_08955 [Euryarchaeota archaeon RBG_16_68_12]|nr:MAG: hypothetical protein A3K65_08955 [Euryarchaeota archaeon RBG_16_68_12]